MLDEAAAKGGGVKREREKQGRVISSPTTSSRGDCGIPSFGRAMEIVLERNNTAATRPLRFSLFLFSFPLFPSFSRVLFFLPPLLLILLFSSFYVPHESEPTNAGPYSPRAPRARIQ